MSGKAPLEESDRSPERRPAVSLARFTRGVRRLSIGGVSLVEAAQEGVATMLDHRLRAGLAALAIAAAVTTIASVSVVLDGVSRFARASAARAFGSDAFVLAKVAAPGQISRRELERKLARNPDIRRADVRFLERHAAGRVLYGASVSGRVEVAAGARRYDGASLVAATAELASIRDLAIERGRFFTPQEEARAAPVAIVGPIVADELFPGLDPLGRTLRLAGRGFRVIGVQERQGNVAGSSLDRNVWIPLPAYERAFGSPDTLQVLARAPQPDAPPFATVAAEDQARVTMRARHQLEPGEDDDFDILSPEAARSFVQRLAERIGLAAGPISAMALLTAILVVANTILVSVTQRTREIGIRRAVGASRRQILAEVLAESIAIALCGGVAGVTAVYGLVAVASNAGLDIRLAPATVVWSLLAAAASGLVAGWLPARRATRVGVVDALRAE
jgi:putative ABC transport system permease protein